MPAPPAPAQVIRDLLGIVRLLWRARAEAGASVAELDAIRVIGESLSLGLDLAKSGPRTLGGRAALQRADEAVLHLGIYIGEQSVSGLLSAAEGRLLAARRG
jgi:hypothetical protein